MGMGTSGEARATQTLPPGLVDKPRQDASLAIVTPPHQSRLQALTTQRVLAFEARKSEDVNLGADRSLTQAPAGRDAPKATKAIKKAPPKTRAKRTLALKMPTVPALKPAGAVPPPPKRKGTPKGRAAASGRGKKAAAVSGEPTAVPVLDEQTVVTASDLRRVLAEGIYPVSTQIATLSKQIGEVYDTVSRISTSLHTQGVGNERTAHAVVQLQGAVQGVYDGVVTRTKTEPAPLQSVLKSTANPVDEDDRFELATRNQVEVAEVRTVAKHMMLTEVITTTAGLHVMPSGARVLDICYQATEHVLGVDRAGAQEYMDSRRIFINADGEAAEKRAPVSEKLNRIKGHLFEALQKVAMVAYFKSLGINVAALTPAEAETWLADARYAKSPAAKTATKAALKALFMRNGGESRVVQPTTVWEEEYINASMGHVALVAYWACTVFEKVVGVRKTRRSGNDDSSYDGWREQMIIVNSFLRRHTKPLDGLQLCDGDDAGRVRLVADDGTDTVDADAEVSASRVVAAGGAVGAGEEGPAGEGGGVTMRDSVAAAAGRATGEGQDASVGMDGPDSRAESLGTDAPDAPPVPDVADDGFHLLAETTEYADHLGQLLEEEEL